MISLLSELLQSTGINWESVFAAKLLSPCTLAGWIALLDLMGQIPDLLVAYQFFLAATFGCLYFAVLCTGQFIPHHLMGTIWSETPKEIYRLVIN